MEITAMKIKLSLRLGLHSSDEERQVPPGYRVVDLRDDYLAECPAQHRRMVVDKQDVFRGGILLNGSLTELDEPLKDGDHLIILIMVNM